MKSLPRETFERLVQDHQADKYSKGFHCWDQLLAMIYAQLSGASSLWVLAASFNSQQTHHYHLGTNLVRRSTLAEANEKRKVEVFVAAARLLMSQAKRSLRKAGEELLYCLDSTSITLKGHGFDSWTEEQRTRHTQGLKVHVLYAVHQALPCHSSITPPNVNDRDEGVKLAIEPGVRYVFDKAYCDYHWWLHIEEQKAHFVTRFKRNAALAVERYLPIPAEAAGIVLADELVCFTNKNPGGGRQNRYLKPLRRIVMARADKEQPLVLATNDVVSPALLIGKNYQDRWQIELFFKWIKQHLKIKIFFGRSENAVRIQIVTALISYLLVTLYKAAHRITDSLWMLLSELRATHFQRPSLEAALYQQRRERIAEFTLRQPGLFT